MSKNYFLSKRLLCLFVPLFFLVSVYAQVDDSTRVAYYLQQVKLADSNEGKLELLDEVIAEFKKRADKKRLAGFYREKANTLYKNESLDSALVAYKNAIHVSESIYDSTALAVSLVGAGGMLMELARYEESRSYCKKGLNIRKALRDTAGVISAINSLAVSYQYQGDRKKAFEILKEALQWSKSIKSYSNQPRLLLNLGVNAKTLGRYSESLSYLNRSYFLIDSLQNPRLNIGKVFIQNMKAGVYYNLGMYDLSVQYCDSLRQLSDQYNFATGKKMFLSLMARNSTKLNNPQLIKQYSEELKGLLSKMDSPADRAVVYNNIGGMYAEQDSFLQANEYYRKSIVLYERLESKPNLSSVYQLLGELYATKQQLDSATMYINRSAELARESGNLTWPIIAYGSLGFVYLESGLFEEAIPLLHQAEITADTLGRRRDLQEIQSYLFTAYDTLGQYEKALEYNIKVLAAERVLQNTRNAAVLAEVNASYQVDETIEKLEQTAQQLTQEVLLHEEEKAKRQKMTIIAIAGLLILSTLIFFVLQIARLRKKRNQELQIHNRRLNEKNEHLALQTKLINGQKTIIEHNNLALSQELEIVKTELDEMNLIQSASIQFKGGVRLRPLSIYYIQSDRNYIKVYSEDYPKGHSSKQTLTHTHNELPSKHFVQINKSTIINLAFIQQIGTKDILLQNGTWLKLSPIFQTALMQKQKAFLVTQEE